MLETEEDNSLEISRLDPTIKLREDSADEGIRTPLQDNFNPNQQSSSYPLMESILSNLKYLASSIDAEAKDN